MLCWLLQKVLNRYWPQIFLKIPRPYALLLPFCCCVLLYCAFVGFEIPALRTLLSCFCLSVLIWLRQKISALTLLLLSASLLLLFDPFQFYQLPFGCPMVRALCFYAFIKPLFGSIWLARSLGRKTRFSLKLWLSRSGKYLWLWCLWWLFSSSKSHGWAQSVTLSLFHWSVYWLYHWRFWQHLLFIFWTAEQPFVSVGRLGAGIFIGHTQCAGCATTD